MYEVNYELVGTIPSMNVFRDTLPSMIAQYEAGKAQAALHRAELTETFKSGGPKAVAALMDQRFKDPEISKRVALGATIEMCAQHFYGIDTVSVNSIGEVIAAIKAIDQDLQF
jgi:hypothetical protein